MLTILIVMSAVAWLATGLGTGAVISYNNLSIAGWSQPTRIAVALLGPITAIVTTLYFAGEFLAMMARACIEPAWDFVKH